MSKSNTVVASTATIRAWVKENMDLTNVTDGDGKEVSTASILGAAGDGSKVRGRIAPFFRDAYLAANPGHVFGEGESAPPARTVALPLVSQKTGRPIKPVTVSVTEAKALAGVEGKRGRLSSDELARAAKAYQG
jgi:hypothetical protein